MATTNGIPIIFGGAMWMAGYSSDDVAAWFPTIEEHGISVIDTAEAYGASEELLGQAGAASKFVIDTKSSTGFGGPVSTKDVVIASGKKSLANLKTDSLDVYYLHCPDHRVSFKDTLSGVNELYKQGAFKRLGLSNFSADDVEEVVKVSKENNWVVPSVYQGNYSAVARRTETEIFPTLRKHNIAFYAYSPIAGGFLSKSKAELTDPEGRFGKAGALAQIYNGMYNRPSFVEALGVWEEIAKEEGITKAELAYRWIVYHSKLDAALGDAVIIGARNQEQFRETMAGIKKGPLSDKAAKKIDGIWESVKAEASLDNVEMLRNL